MNTTSLKSNIYEMKKENETINDRLIAVMNYYNLNARQFALHCNIEYQTIKQNVSGRRSKPGSDVLDRILMTYPEISGNWLITGVGEMFRKDYRMPAESYVDEPERRRAERKRLMIDDISRQNKENAVDALAGIIEIYVKRISRLEKRLDNVFDFLKDKKIEYKESPEPDEEE